MAHDTSTYYEYRTPYGFITVGVKDDAIDELRLGKTKLTGAHKACTLSNTCATELLEYFAGKRYTFDVPCAAEGSTFQRDVWDAVTSIPYGQAYTNAEVAEMIGRPDSYRMVGSAVQHNPIAILIPTHRVVGANGHATGSTPLARQRDALLRMERRYMQAQNK